MLMSCGTLVPAKFPVPQNPITAALAGLTPARFTLPENPIMRAVCGLSSCGAPLCSCPGGLCSCGHGMGDITSSVSSFMDSVTSGGWQTYAAIGGVILLFLMTSGGSGRKADLAAAKAQYLARKASIQSKSRGYKRLGRAVGMQV